MDFNNDGKTDLDDLFSMITYYIGKVDKKTIQGKEKKELVMSSIEKLLSKENYERYEPILDKSIDYIVLLSKKKEILDNINKVTKKCYKLCCS
jgi:prophage maintenance system killer protein